MIIGECAIAAIDLVGQNSISIDKCSRAADDIPTAGDVVWQEIGELKLNGKLVLGLESMDYLTLCTNQEGQMVVKLAMASSQLLTGG